MKFKATVPTMLNKDILDPKGKVVLDFKNLGFDHFAGVRKDKRMKLEIETENKSTSNYSLMGQTIERFGMVINTM